MVLINTVSREVKLFSHRVRGGVSLAKRAYRLMGFPSRKDFKNMTRIMLISNFPIIPDYIAVANKIYGPNLHSLKFKIVRKQPTLVMTDYITLPPELIKQHGYVTVAIDVIYVKNMTFVVSTSRVIRFVALEYVNDRPKATIMALIKKIINLYSKRTFKVTNLLINP